ncbi:hypothetical protein P3875_04885 [Myroides sp. JBRI-B21084]|uniref:hypothetical protein n=1 Tax=Myroides sp. JBRI-B21084 TaxID=3119977 RepID=UPI0026E2310A|nr:hypothetical protein [Paenimyroides cloacae]WKW47399.1 hypothetical protein P3875_04885 [Paenimyroides cloacae]
MKKIQTGFLVSYDYEKLKKSIPPVYEHSDQIFLALDHENRTWTGNKFEINDSFFSWIEEFDTEKKIIIYKDNFYIPELSPIDNDTRERQMLGEKMGIGNWIIQIDADEFFLDFDKFVKTLKKHDLFLDNPKKNKVQFSGFLINIYKYLDKGLLYVDDATKFMVATNYPNYKRARNTKERVIYVPHYALHETLSRTEEELAFKISNWGHKDEINSDFFKKWKLANETNYKQLKDLFYLNPKIWKSLGYFPSENLHDIKQFIIENQDLKKSDLWIFKKNFGQWFKHLFK